MTDLMDGQKGSGGKIISVIKSRSRQEESVWRCVPTINEEKNASVSACICVCVAIMSKNIFFQAKQSQAN